ncbi:hypothetical protein Plhal304r1_c012g0046461 [Plasmopara halstedii]
MHQADHCFSLTTHNLKGVFFPSPRQKRVRKKLKKHKRMTSDRHLTSVRKSV